tara:strand:- start:1009 stop:3522 length:2514 start_codon:yes stop_codon:yes gene_type:complete
MASTIQIKRGTGSAVPTGLADGELAINLDNNRLYFGSGSAVKNSFRVAELIADTATITQVTSSIVSSSILFSSGSNIFGDALSDTHTFNGNVTASNALTVANNLTVGGNINANGNIIGDDSTNITNIATIQSDNFAGDINGDHKLQITSDALDLRVDDTSILELKEGQSSFSTNVTASGNISSSGDVFATDLSLGGSSRISSTAGTVQILDHLDVANGMHITASGDISSSGNVIANQIRANGRVYTNYNLSNEHFIRNTSVNNPMVSAVGGFHTGGNITSSKNISASSHIIASRIYGGADGAFITTANGQIQSSTGFVGTNITASSNISASGTITSLSASINRIDSVNISASGNTISRQFFPGENITMPDGGVITDIAGNNDEILFDQTNRKIITKIDNDSVLTIASGRVGILTTTPPANMELTVAGDISASSNVYGNKAIFTSVTASGNISASGTSNILYQLTLDHNLFLGGGRHELNSHASNTFSIKSGSTTVFQIGPDAYTNFLGNITASGDISSSGAIVANQFVIDNADANGISLNSSTNAQLDITAGNGGALSNAYFKSNQLEVAGDILMAENLTHRGDTDTKITFGTDQMDFIAGNVTMIALDETANGNSISLNAPITASGNISCSGNLIINGIQGSTTTGDQSGSLILSGSLTLRPNQALPSVSSSVLYATGSDGKGTNSADLHFGGMPIGPYTTQMFNCGFQGAATSKVWLPFAEGGLTDLTATTTTSEYASIIMPFDGYVDQVLVRSENDCGDVIVGTHISTDGQEIGSTTAGEAVTVDMSTDDTTRKFGFSSSFAAGNTVSVSFDPTSVSGDTVATLIVKFDMSKGL